MNKFEQSIVEFLQDTVGIKDVKLSDSLVDKEFKSIFKTEIDPKDAGVLMPMFSEIKLNVSGHSNVKMGYAEFSLRYSYRHTGGGTNGFSANYMTNGDKVILRETYFNNELSFG